jgi:phosphoenolpyruvate carboxykinase (ATP)
VPSSLPGVEDDELLSPRRLYERQGRLSEYEEITARLEEERIEYLSSFTALSPRVLEGLG